MADDYREDPELDHYDPEMLDDAEHAPITAQQRRAAERSLDQRDRLDSRRRQRSDPGTPGFPLSSPGMSDGERSGPESTPGSARRVSKRRRTGLESGRGEDPQPSERD